MERKLLMSYSHVCPVSVFWHTVLGRTCGGCTELVCVDPAQMSVLAFLHCLFGHCI